jgi:hypothetical protein
MTEVVILCCLLIGIAYFWSEEEFILLQSNGGIIISRGKLKKFAEKTCSSATSSTTKFRIIHRGLNLGLRDEKPESNRQSYGKVLQNENIK